MDIKKVNEYAVPAVDKARPQSSGAAGNDKHISGREASTEADRVNWSRSYQEMAQVRKVMMHRDDIRAERVDHLRQAIRDGDYEIKLEELADRMLDEI